MSDYEKRILEYEYARNTSMDEWFSAREKTQSRSRHSEFIFEGGFRMAWELLQKEIAINTGGE